MRLPALAAFFFSLAAMSAFAQTLSFQNILDRPGRPQPDHRIAYGPHPNQFGELWLPPDARAKLPIVVLVHGGCWRTDLPGPELVAFLAAALRQEGVAVWSITYRRVGTTSDRFSPYPDTFHDVAAATEKLRELASPYGLDLGRIVTTGHSAGGHLALWIAARHRLPADSPLFVPSPLKIGATVGIAALADLAYAKVASAHACGADTVDRLINTADRKEAAYRDTSIPPLLPLSVPTTLVSGVYDGIVAPAHALRYCEAARGKGETVVLKTLDGAGHFEIVAPWTAPGAEVVRIIVEAARSLSPTPAR